MGLRDHLPSLIARYTAGETLEQIGSSHGVTRERVRQLLAREGIRRTDGGKSVQGRATKARRAVQLRANADARRLRVFGCDQETFARLNYGIVESTARGSPSRGYLDQKRNANERGIGWEITFPEWVRVWEESGHLHERGRGANGYCMARKGDQGPYQVGNVYITTCRGNGRDYQEKRMGRPAQGWHIRKENTRRPYVVSVSQKYVGSFKTEAEARIAYQAARKML